MDGDGTLDEAVAAERAAGHSDSAVADDAVEDERARTDRGNASVRVRSRQQQPPRALFGYRAGSVDCAGVGQVLDAIKHKRSAVVHHAADDRSGITRISLPNHKSTRADRRRAGVGVVGHEPDSCRGRVRHRDPARAGNDVKE